MQIVKLNDNISLTAKLAVKCIEEGYYLPYSFIHILALIYLNKNYSVNEIAELAVAREIVYSEQVVKNYISTMKNFGILEKNRKGYRKISKQFLS